MNMPPALGTGVNYGSDFCKHYNSTKLRYDTFAHFFNNLISIKNVYFARQSNGEAIVLKKLGHNRELARITTDDGDGGTPTTKQALDGDLDHLIRELTRLESVTFCNAAITKMFLAEALDKFTPEQVGTMARINIEPLMLHVFRELTIFPEYLGACGHFVVVKDCGRPLMDFAGADWHIRAYLAVQLLQAARDMTEMTGDFSLYLTDISPDNIAVDSGLNVYFVDVENAIVNDKETTHHNSEHHTRHFDGGDHFAFEEPKICRGKVSDHNIYSVCWLLLSRKAPWPMTKGGLLHSPPAYIKPQSSRLSWLIEECVTRRNTLDRFTTSLELIQLLQKILLIN